MAREFARQFYHSQEWQAVRNYVLMRDKWLCARCGKPATEVHHVVHLTPGNIGDMSVALNPDNLVSLCRDCHMKEHTEDAADGRRKERAVLPRIVFDDAGNAIAMPRIETR